MYHDKHDKRIINVAKCANIYIGIELYMLDKFLRTMNG